MLSLIFQVVTRLEEILQLADCNNSFAIGRRALYFKFGWTYLSIQLRFDVLHQASATVEMVTWFIAALDELQVAVQLALVVKTDLTLEMVCLFFFLPNRFGNYFCLFFNRFHLLNLFQTALDTQEFLAEGLILVKAFFK